MKNKRFLVIGIALVLMAMVVGVAVATTTGQEKEGYYRDNWVIGLTKLDNSTWYVLFLDSAGRIDYKAEARVSNNINHFLEYTVGGTRYYIERGSSNNQIRDTRTGYVYTFYQPL
jgi:hypothetical protein